ncbi:DegT/DnrJ/EryC1/StrS family aminotransferase [uncultured Friedmanniella sp.]|uniref:DegT/DnrJ/EryC1/StrS family aminotransferase n=1 Tax=uncultured Friedmanniella sp. TaxID=335381 RepID=UPI0035C9750A
MSAVLRFARKRLDLGLGDLAYGLFRCALPPSREDSLAALDQLWTPADSVVACLSARSGFDLLLATVDWPAGSEVLLSALTIPHLATLVRAHGYVPVAVDVDPATVTLDPAEVRAACTPRTRALVVAQLFGARPDLTEVAAVARGAGLLLVEDRAECFDGLDRDLGPLADVALFSFGTIKTASCLGGGVLLVRDRRLRERMRSRQRHDWPVQTSTAYAAKLAKGALMLVIGHPFAFGTFARLADRLTGDYDGVVRTLSRGYPDEDLLESIRRRPSCALLAMMVRRIRGYDPARVAARRRAGHVLAGALGPDVVQLGGQAAGHTYWLFPVVSRDPDTLVTAGRAAGFDLTRGSSTLVALDEHCRRTWTAMASVVYLPAYAGMSERDLRGLAAVVTEVESRVPPLNADAAGHPSRSSNR